MLPNAYFLAKFRFDTAENEPAKNFQNLKFAKSCKFANFHFANPNCLHRCLGYPGGCENAFFENAFFENAFFENFANFWRARSRLCQNEILQENMRLNGFVKLYKIYILLHRCNL